MNKFFDFGEEQEKKPAVIKTPIKVESKRVTNSFDREKVFNTPDYTFKYGGKTYECIGNWFLCRTLYQLHGRVFPSRL